MVTPIPRIQVPATVAKGEVFEVKALISHPMDTGLLRDGHGRLIPRKIIRSFVCRYNGEEVFRVELHEAMAANPYFEFHLRATGTGRIDCVWEEDGGAVYTLTQQLTVE